MPLINFAGIASGIDSNALIDATVTARRQQRVQPNEEKVTQLTDTNDTLEEIKTKMRDFQTKLGVFSSLNNGGIAKTTRSSDETMMTAVASSSANNGTYSITPSQLAKNATYAFESSGYTYTQTDGTDLIAPTMSGSDTIQITIGNTPEQQVINLTVDNTTTIGGLISTFNNSTSKATAALVNIGTSASPDMRMVITTANEGTLKGEIAVSVGAAITADTAFDSNTVSNAQNAQFKVTGIGPGAGTTITRYSNTFSDIIPGVTVTLQNTSTSAVTLTIGDDAAATASAIQEFVDAYNDLVKYISENDLVQRQEDGENVENVFNPLAGTQVDEGILQAIRSNIASTSYANGGAVKRLTDLGISTERDGTLKFKSDTLEEALGLEPFSAREILRSLSDTLTLTGGTIDRYTRFNGLLDISITGNKELISNLNDRIARDEAAITKEADSMRQRFARLESLIGRMQNQQSSLTSALASLQK